MMLRKTTLAAAIRIHERDIDVRRIMCRQADEARIREFCDCLLTGFPRGTRATLAADVPDAELVPYDGDLILTNLQIN